MSQPGRRCHNLVLALHCDGRVGMQSAGDMRARIVADRLVLLWNFIATLFFARCPGRAPASPWRAGTEPGQCACVGTRLQFFWALA